jgi:NAD(P)-dependent dehydrogenase (short-subunit alcohol dehydrogenase family)
MANRVAVVTGASSGLGLEVSKSLLRRGVRVVGVARRPDQAVAELGGDFVLLTADVASPGAAEEAFGLAAGLGAKDILVNCAGVGVFGPCGTFGREDVDQVLQGNLIGTVLFSEQAIRSFQSGGVIVNVMSTAAQVGRANEAIYCASKWGARGYTESIRAELKGRGIRVIAVYPGGMNTRFWKEARGVDTDASKFMDPREVAETIVEALLHSGSGYVTDLIIGRG